MSTADLPALRYVDGPSTEASIDIAAPPARVWALVSDLQLPARFSSEFEGAELLGGATVPAVGVRFVGRNHHPAIGSWETTSTITTFDPPNVLAYDVDGADGLSSATWRFTLVATGDGTRLTQWMRVGPGRSGISQAIDAMPDKESKILHRRLGEHRSNMTATLAGIKALAEAGEL
jgi:uncharacterized protein YndB with AHSA1/START domain